MSHGDPAIVGDARTAIASLQTRLDQARDDCNRAEEERAEMEKDRNGWKLAYEGRHARVLELTAEMAGTEAKLRMEIGELKAELAIRSGNTAAMDALNKIAKLCGCEEWDYPGQVVRDVQSALGVD